MSRLKKQLFLLLTIGFMLSCKTKTLVQPTMVNHIADVQINYLQVNDETGMNDTEIEAMINPYREKLSAEMNEVIATLETTMYKGRPNSNMGNWLADLLHEEAEILTNQKIDFALQNYGGIRIGSVEKGDIKVMKVFEIMPFDNELVVMNLSGELIKKLCDRIAEYGGWPVSHGLKMGILDNESVNIMIGGKPFDESRNYTIALPDYVAGGGDKCFFLEDQAMQKTGMMIREVMIKNLKRKTSEGKTIQASNEKRLIIQ